MVINYFSDILVIWESENSHVFQNTAAQDTQQHFIHATCCFLTPDCHTSYPMSSEDKHWAEHTEDQQNSGEAGHNELCVVPPHELLEAFNWKTHISHSQPGHWNAAQLDGRGSLTDPTSANPLTTNRGKYFKIKETFAPAVRNVWSLSEHEAWFKEQIQTVETKWYYLIQNKKKLFKLCETF